MWPGSAYLEAHQEGLALHMGKGHVQVAYISILVVEESWSVQLYMGDLPCRCLSSRQGAAAVIKHAAWACNAALGSAEGTAAARQPQFCALRCAKLSQDTRGHDMQSQLHALPE